MIHTLTKESIELIREVVLQVLNGEPHRLTEYRKPILPGRHVRIARTTTTTTYPSDGNFFEVELGEFGDFDETTALGSVEPEFTADSPQEIRRAYSFDGSFIPENTVVFMFLASEKWYITTFSGTELQFYTLLEDALDGHGQWVWAEKWDWTGDRTPIKLYNPHGMMNKYKAGHNGIMHVQGGRWTHTNSPCPADECIPDGSFNYAVDLPNATEGAAYSIIPTSFSNATSLTHSGLPAGLSFNTSTGEVTGTPTENGSFNLVFTAQVPQQGGTASQFCTITRYRPLTVEAP